MPRILRTNAAQRDAAEIWHYIAMDSPSAADRLIDQFHAKLTFLSEYPGAGTDRKEFGRGVRSLPVGSYVIFFRKIDDGIEVLRILHGARNLRRLFRGTK